MKQSNVVRTGNVVGILGVALFLLCMVWGLLLSDPILKELHLNILRITFPGFSMSLIGALVGAVESFVYGWVLGALFFWLHKIM